MLERPEDLREDELLRTLGEWGLGDVSLTYAAVGFGDHHWVAGADRRWFVTVADLVTKGDTLDGLRAAMDTAYELRQRDGLDFVVAPLPTPAGQTVRPLGPRYAVSVFPFLDGVSGEFGREWTPRERADVLGLLAVLHRQRPPAAAPVLRPELGLRGLLEKALAGSLQWAEGPFSDPARSLLREYAPVLRQRLAEFDALVTELDGAPVVTHGEPHPGNLLSHDGGYALVDWDTAGLAPPERDLWSVVRGPDDLARYAEISGRTPDPAALCLYRLRWDLEETCVYTDWFRSPHVRSPDMEEGWNGLVETLRNLAHER
ncbi:phosphotransferase enzyme family protein [Actinomadura kijaniata]|uniref:phosphotransferase enzyme family protein n=1 Tax=Actinomadura kijaniata TaxID=46161 RepID=UPI000AAE6BA9|nr:aminoglycoside phosphotransferase family protein [Actinomadura kijaniata]